MNRQANPRKSFVSDGRGLTSFISRKPTLDNNKVCHDIENQKTKLESLEGEVAKVKKCTILLVIVLTIAFLALLFMGVLMAISRHGDADILADLGLRTTGAIDPNSKQTKEEKWIENMNMLIKELKANITVLHNSTAIQAENFKKFKNNIERIMKKLKQM